MKKTIILLLTILSLSSCVSKRLYEELDNKYNRLKNQNTNLVGENDELFSTTKDLENENKNLKSSIDSLSSAKAVLQSDVTALVERKKQLEKSFQELSESSNVQLDAKAKEILMLSNQLNEKENALIAENTRLEKMKIDLAVRSELQNFEGKGLTVHRKNGKVYVSMENKLLFGSGSWAVGSQGKSAIVELAKVLRQNQDIEVLIEGHTDNVPYHGNTIQDNWDLSTKRATAIVRILVNNNVGSKRVTAAGRGEFSPIESNNTTQGKAKNRRIEVVLAPNLDAINNLLEED